MNLRGRSSTKVTAAALDIKKQKSKKSRKLDGSSKNLFK